MKSKFLPITKSCSIKQIGLSLNENNLNFFNNKCGFSLAEMMVVMLIMSVVLAAMAPMITTRIKADQAVKALSEASDGNNPWKWVEGSETDAYSQASRNLIGQTEAKDGDDAMLVINTGGEDKDDILFKSEDDIIGRIKMLKTESNNSMLIGTKSDTGELGQGAVSIGYDNLALGSYSIALGESANASQYSAIALGKQTEASGNYSIAIGAAGSSSSERTSASADYSIAMGYNASASDVNATIPGGFAASIAIGYKVTASDEDTIAIGAYSKASNNWAIAMGYNAEATTLSSIALGYYAKASGGGTGGSTVAIGSIAVASGTYSTAVGNGAKAEGYASAALGYDATAKGNHSVAIGYNAVAENQNEIVLGSNEYKVIIPGTLTVNGTNVTSDKCLKYINGENKSGLDVIKQIKVYNFTYKKDKEKTPRVGIIAQELQKILPDAVKKGSDGFLTIRIDDIIYSLVNAVKELDRKVSELTETLKQVQAEQKLMKAEQKRINQRLDALGK